LTLISPTTLFWVLYLFKGDACTIYVVILTGILLAFTIIAGILDNIAGTEKMLRQELKNQGKDPNTKISITLEDKSIAIF